MAHLNCPVWDSPGNADQMNRAAQNPTPATFDHQPSNPDQDARATTCPSATPGFGRPAPTGHGSRAATPSVPEPPSMTADTNRRV